MIFAGGGPDVRRTFCGNMPSLRSFRGTRGPRIEPSERRQPARADAVSPAAADPWITAHLDELAALYTHLHTHPELSRSEIETSKRIADELNKAGATVTTNVGKLGVVGVLKNGEGPVVLVRTDMDALPVVEDTGLAYASKVKTRDSAGRDVGVMHACGHDIHMTSFIGTARWLAEHRDRWSGTVVLVGQPAEEAVDGARHMLKDGLYTRFPKPDFALALHCRPDEPIGTIRYCSGPTLASSTSLIDHDSGQGRTRRMAAPHDRSDRACGARGARPANDRQPRDRARRAGGRDSRLHSRRDQAQHHSR